MKDLIQRPLKHRGFFLRIGFVFALILTILAFHWKPNYQPPKVDYGNSDNTPVMELIASNIKEKKKERTKKKIEKANPEIKSDQIKVVKEKPVEKTSDPKPELDLSQMTQNPIGEGPVDDQLRKGPVHFAEDQPEFPGGEDALREYIRENIHYPQDALRMGIGGKVFVRFVVDQFGNVTDVSIARGVHPLLDKEAIRVISQLPQWEPGRQNGKPVSVIFTIDIKFESR